MNLKIVLSAAFLTSAFAVGAQNANKGYAITGDGNKDYMWMNIRTVDLASGQVTKTIFQHGQTNFTITDNDSRQTLDQTALNDVNAGYTPSQYPTATFVAAAALDRRSDKLFFIPMRMGQLRWMDISSKGDGASFYSVNIPGYKPSAQNEEANNITRMVIGADNFGYAVTNDGQHLYRFTTGKKPTVTDLGPLADADENGSMSIHNRCSSWGGDMIADAYGKLYIIAGTRNVFVVDPATRITTFKGNITGLPATYTTNGAAVDADGNVILSSATAFEGYFKMNIKDLKAEKIEGSDMKYNASDLASGNLLFQKEADEAKQLAMIKTPATTTPAITENLIYPNPVRGNTFNILLDKTLNGNYTVVISDLAGRALQSERAGFVKGQQSYQVNLTQRPSKGTYIVKVYDANNNVVLSDKVMVL